MSYRILSIVNKVADLVSRWIPHGWFISECWTVSVLVVDLIVPVLCISVRKGRIYYGYWWSFSVLSTAYLLNSLTIDPMIIYYRLIRHYSPIAICSSTNYLTSMILHSFFYLKNSNYLFCLLHHFFISLYFFISLFMATYVCSIGSLNISF